MRDLARRLTDTLRRSDIVGRFGGEEFLIVLPYSDVTAARVAIGKVLQAVRTSAVAYEAATLRYTASAGIAAFTPGDDALALIARADAALYRAKANGRDCLDVDVPTATNPPGK